MKILNLTKAFASLAIVGMLFSSCDKKEEIDPIGDRGQTLIKILGGGKDSIRTGNPNDELTVGSGLKSMAIDFVNTSQRIVLADIRRDVPNNEELMKPMTVTIVEDTDLVNIAGYADFPQAWYELVPTPGVVKTGGTGGTYTVTFQPGEFAKQIEIIVPNATLLNPSLNYGLGFRILNASQGNVTVNNSLVTTIGAKNKYDGIYNVTGTFSHAVNAAFVGNYPRQYHLITTGANSVKVAQLINGEIVPGYLFLNGAAGTFFGSFGIQLTFDPSSDAIIDLRNFYGDPANGPATGVGNPQLGTGAPLYASTANGRRATLDPSGLNRYDEATKTVFVKYFMYQPSVVATAPAAFFNETMVYAGPR